MWQWNSEHSEPPRFFIYIIYQVFQYRAYGLIFHDFSLQELQALLRQDQARGVRMARSLKAPPAQGFRVFRAPRPKVT